MFLFSDADATSIFFWYSAGTYLAPLLGGYICDAYLGKMFTIIDFSVIYIIGAVALTVSALTEWQWLAFLGLVLIALGTGGIKPCVAAFGAQQLRDPRYSPPTGWTQEKMVSIYFSSFYLSINLGSMFSYILLPLARRYGGFEAAFGSATIVLVVSLLAFMAPCRGYLREKPKGSVLASVLSVMGAACSEQCRTRGPFWWLSCSPASADKALIEDGAAGGDKDASDDDGALVARGSDDGSDDDGAATGSAVSPLGGSGVAAPKVAAVDEAEAARRLRSSELRRRAGCLNSVRGRFSDDMVDGAASITSILPVFSIIALFWALYDQQGNAWVLQAKRMDLGPFEPDQLGAINPILVMLMLPVYRAVILPCLERIGRCCPLLKPTPLRRMGVGMLLAAFTFVLSAGVEQLIDTSAPGSVSVAWQLPQWVLITIAELFLSVTGLEWAYTQADKNLQGVCMAAWFFSNGLGDVLGGVLYQVTKEMGQVSIYLMFAALMVVAFFVYTVLAACYVDLPPEPVERVEDGAEEESEALMYASPGTNSMAQSLELDPTKHYGSVRPPRRAGGAPGAEL